MNKKKILFYTDGYNLPTGLSKQATYIANNIRDKYDVCFFCLSNNLIEHNLYNIPLYTRQNGDQDLETTLLEVFFKEKPDIILSILDLWSLTPLVTLKNKVSFKWVAYLPIDSDPIPERIYNIRNDESKPLNYILKNIDKLVSYGSFGYKCLKEKGFESEIIPHCVDIEVYKPIDNIQKAILRKRLAKKININANLSDYTLFLYVGINYHRKCLDILFQAWEYFLNKNAKSSKKALFIVHSFHGDVTGWDLDSLRKQYNLNNILISKKSISEKELLELYQMSDCLLNASCMEGFGLPILESMSCGLSVIHPNSVGMQDFQNTVKVNHSLIKNSSATSMKQYLVNPKDYAEQIYRLYKNKSGMENIKNNCRQEVINYYNVNDIVDLWKETLDKI